MFHSEQLSLAALERSRPEQRSLRGLFIALTIVGGWASSLSGLLFFVQVDWHSGWIWLAIAVQTFLYTGLFITAHDAMHRSLYPQNERLNDWIGTVAVSCYAFFSYKTLLHNHRLHHRHPASHLDPDFHDGQHSHLLLWYGRFLKQYWSWPQFLTATVVFYGLRYVAHIPNENLVLFWIIPSLLSSVQLFYFGTFLPHREPDGGYTNHHRAQSSALPVFWSFLTCYHFGYHEEHHAHPYVPWWQLPWVKQTGF